MLTVKDILTDRITLDIECVDRVYLNGYVKYLQMPGGLITFIREQMGFPIPSPIVLPPVSQAFRKAVEQFATAQGLTIVDFARDEEKDETARAHRARFAKPNGVVLIGKAQEKTLGFTARRKDHGTKVWFEYSRREVWVTHYYFYILDEDFGGCSLSKSAPTFPLMSRSASMDTSGPNSSCARPALILKRLATAFSRARTRWRCNPFVTNWTQ